MNAEEAKKQAKAIYDAGQFDVNGRTYELVKMRHQKRLQVFSFYSEFGQQVAQGNFACLVGEQFKHVQKVMFEAMLFEGNQLTKLPDHWDDYPEDFLQVVGTAMGVMSYPFIRGSDTGSTSHAESQQKTSLKKPI